MISPKVDAGVRALLEFMGSQGDPLLESMTPAEARRFTKARSAMVTGAPERVPSVVDQRIPGPLGDIPIRIYRPDVAAPSPGLLYFHGGGWVIGDLDTHDVVCRAIANRARAAVVSVDYRLAPEHKFPAAVVDCYAATEWLASNAARLGIDRSRVSVGGDSAGGNLAAVVCQKALREQGPAIASQVLVYPVTDLSSFATGSYEEFAEDHYLARSVMGWFRAHYLMNLDDALSSDASPLLAADLPGLPRALIITAECDPLRDEGEAYAKRLEQAGVPVTCTRYAGMIHPFFTMGGVIPRAQKAIQQVAEAIAGDKIACTT